MKTAKRLSLILLMLMFAGTPGFAGTFEQISFDTYHSEWNINQGISPTGSDNMAISGDGQIVCFDDMTVGSTGLQCRNRATQTTEVISMNLDGTVAQGVSPAISRDGRYVAYWGRLSNLTIPGASGMYDLYVYDRTNASTVLVAAGEGGNHGLYPPRPVSMSADGRYLVYGPPTYSTSNYAGQVDNGKIFDRVTGTKEDIRPFLPEEIRSSYGQTPPILSGDGRYVAFACYRSSINQYEVYLFDRQTTTIKNISAIGDLNSQYNCFYNPSSISDDGQRLMLSNLSYPGWPLLFDNLNNSFMNVCTTATGEIGENGCENALLSGNGRIVLYNTNSQNLLPEIPAIYTGGVLVKYVDEGVLDWAAVDKDGDSVVTAWNHLSPNGDFLGFITYDSLVKTDLPPADRYWFDRDHYIYERSSIVLKNATYFANKNELNVSVSSRLNEAAGLVLEGFGPMTYRSGSWSTTVNPANGNPESVTISGVEGRSTFRVDAK